MSDPYLTIQRQIQAQGEQLERLRKADVPGVTGTWTPAFAGSVTAGSYTTAASYGSYLRIGNQVLCHGYIRITAIGVSPAGNLWIITLPFAATNNSSLLPAVTFGIIGGIDTTAGKFALTGFVRNNTTHIELAEAQDNAAISLLPATALTTTGELAMSFFYQVDP